MAVQLSTSDRHVTLEQKTTRRHNQVRADRRESIAEQRRDKREGLRQLKRCRPRRLDIEEETPSGEAGPAVLTEEPPEHRVAEAAGILRQFKSSRYAALVELSALLAHDVSCVAAFFEVDGARNALLRALNEPRTQLDAVHCITNIAASLSEHTKQVIDAAPMLITLLESGNVHILDLCANALGNMAADGPECKEKLNANGAAIPLIALLSHREPQVVQSAAFALSQLLRQTSVARRAEMVPAVAPAAMCALESLEGGETSRHVIAELMWMLSELVVANVDALSALIDLDVVDPTLDTVIAEAARDTADPMLVIPCLRVLGTLLAGGPLEVTDLVTTKPGVLETLKQLLQSASLSIRSETTWVVNNVANGELPRHAIAVIDAGFLPHLVGLISGETITAIEALTALLGILHRGGDFVTTVVSANVVTSTVPLLIGADIDLQLLAIQLIEAVCRLHPEGAATIETCGGVDALEAQQLHTDGRVQEAVSYLLNTYFGSAAVDE